MSLLMCVEFLMYLSGHLFAVEHGYRIEEAKPLKNVQNSN